ncbi:energy transducer TonB [Sideroxydans sp. CL21]|uniref:energy transducer TonB n=1 Tax=Sideroxydans sp. CL21 TaxID=2600596 RepID=UPI0024BD266E|nr:energy transducer TonB [Sideroxydans sp. CL21]
MSTDASTWLAQVDVGSPWHRLYWTLPISLLACIIASILFVYSMVHSVSRTPEPVPVDAELIELPASVLLKPLSRQNAPAPKQALPPKQIQQAISPVQQDQPSVNPAPTAPPPAAPATTSPAINNTPETDRNRSAQAIAKPLPAIPDDLRQDAMNEVATARFHIAVDGSVTVELVKPTQNPRLNRLLLGTLKFWKFNPATIDGKPVASVEVIVVRVQVN